MWLISEALMQDYANSLCSQEQGEEFSRVTSLVGVPFAPSSGNLIPRAYLPLDKMTDFSNLSRFGMTFVPFEEQIGADVLTWFLEASHVRTSVLPAKEPDSLVHARDFGREWLKLSATWNRDTCSWKTRPSFLSGDLTLYLETLPRWGSMLDGQLWQRRTLVRIIRETESGLLPTPVKYDSAGRGEADYYRGLGWQARYNWSKNPGADVVHHVTMKEKIANRRRKAGEMLPTPVANDAEKRGLFNVNEHRNGLPAAVRRRQMIPTPIKNDSTSGSDAAGRQGGQSLKQRVRTQIPTPSSQNGLRGGSNSEHRPMMYGSPDDPEYGELNPVWVEWVMGWPINWTSLQPWTERDYANFEFWEKGSTTDVGRNGFVRTLWWYEDPSTPPQQTVELGNPVSDVSQGRSHDRRNVGERESGSRRVQSVRVRIPTEAYSSGNPVQRPVQSVMGPDMCDEAMGPLGFIARTTEKDLPARVERIAALGNGQVSVAAAAAFVHLFNLPFPGDQS